MRRQVENSLTNIQSEHVRLGTADKLIVDDSA